MSVDRPQKLYPYYRNKRFTNYLGKQEERVFFNTAVIWAQSWFARQRQTLSFRSWLPPYGVKRRSFYKKCTLRTIPTITWIGHATFLIQCCGLSILTDPIFGDLSFLFRRLVEPGIALEKLPRIDIVVISHNHWDHMDERALLYLKEKNPAMKVLVPYGDKKWFDARGFRFVSEYTWWESACVSDVTFTFLPAHHWSQRGIFDRNKSLWGSWMIEAGDKKVYFGGDSAYGKHFDVIGKHFPHIDIALLPIGPCEPHERMKLSHMTAEQAGQAFLDLGAQHFVPMHWGTYWFGTEPLLVPVERLLMWWKGQWPTLNEKYLHLVKLGSGLYCGQLERQPLKHIFSSCMKRLRL